MVSEIRSLDGDMQMLVYENYNKFIAATETIRRMKTNVEGMDADMQTVVSTIDKIGECSDSLEETLCDKRGRVDKLVRVKRLLDRLAFLSELPEKLFELIDQREYKTAVSLYSKTIVILQKHSQVLSFANIQKRVEEMMGDLRVKVLDLLDDPNLEPTTLTSYIPTLKLMKAPRHLVVNRYLAAHRNRAARQLAAEGGAESGKVTGAKGASSSPSSRATAVVVARRFHQSFLVGLIECAKGIEMLFVPTTGTARGPSSDVADSTDSADSVFPREEAEKAQNELLKTVLLMLPQYIDRIVGWLEEFFDGQPTSTDVGGIIIEAGTGTGTGTGAVEADSDEYEDEQLRQDWCLFVRQALLDVQFLDAAIEKCAPPLDDGAVVDSKKEKNSCAATLERAVMAVLGRHFNLMLTEAVDKFTTDVKSCVRLVSESAAQIDATYSSASEASSSSSGKTSVAKNNNIILKRACTAGSELVSELLVAARPLLEVASVCFLPSTHTMFCSTAGCLDRVSIHSDADSATESEATLSMGVVRGFSSKIIEVFGPWAWAAQGRWSGSYLGDGTNTNLYTHPKSHNFPQGEGRQGGGVLSPAVLLDQCYPLGNPDPANTATDAPVGKMAALSAREKHACLCLIAARSLRTLAESLASVQSLKHIMTSAGLQPPSRAIMTSSCATIHTQLASCSQACLASFVELESSIVENKSESLLRSARGRRQSDKSSPASVSVSPVARACAIAIGRSLLHASILLSKPPPSTSWLASGVEGMHSKFAPKSARGGHTGTGGIHFDIDRLFSARVLVFDSNKLEPCPYALTSVCWKSLFKALLEQARTLTLSFAAALQMSTDIYFLRTAALAVLPPRELESNEVSSLADHVLQVLAGRCEGQGGEVGGDGVTSADLELPEIPKVVCEALSEVSTKVPLFGGPNR